MTVHIIGMGISGLSAAFTLTRAGVSVALYDAAARAGGRCHSFFDKRLNAQIDNGTHLMLGANTALLNMLAQCPSDTPLKNAGNKILFFKKTAVLSKLIRRGRYPLCSNCRNCILCYANPS